VIPKWRNRGIGTNLIRFAENRLFRTPLDHSPAAGPLIVKLAVAGPGSLSDLRVAELGCVSCSQSGQASSETRTRRWMWLSKCSFLLMLLMVMGKEIGA